MYNDTHKFKLNNFHLQIEFTIFINEMRKMNLITLINNMNAYAIEI